MQMPKHSDEAKQHFRALVADDPAITVKPMFGSVGAFVGGHMYAGLLGDRFGVKLSPDERPDLEAVPGTGPFGPESRPMAGWVSLPPAMSDADAAAWFERARGWVATLPPKEPRPKDTKGAKKA